MNEHSASPLFKMTDTKSYTRLLFVGVIFVNEY